MKALILKLCLLPLTAAAQVYKYLGHDGSTGYSALPYGQPAAPPAPACIQPSEGQTAGR